MSQLLDLVADFPGWVAFLVDVKDLISGKGLPPATATREVLAQRMPGVFGNRRECERIFETLRQALLEEKRPRIDAVVGKMKNFEADIFRAVIAGMSCGNHFEDVPVNNPKKGQPATFRKAVTWENTPQDLRVKFLTEIADEVGSFSDKGMPLEEAAERVVKNMRARHLIARSPFERKVMKRVRQGVKLVEKVLLEIFGVSKLEEVTRDQIALRLNLFAAKIPDRQTTKLGAGFWISWWRDNRWVAPSTALLLVGLSVWFCVIVHQHQ